MPNDRDEDDEPKSERIPGRDFAGASWAATEREQTKDLRNRDPAAEEDVSLGALSDDLPNKHAPKDD
jgi:hypothetical protein